MLAGKGSMACAQAPAEMMANPMRKNVLPIIATQAEEGRFSVNHSFRRIVIVVILAFRRHYKPKP